MDEHRPAHAVAVEHDDVPPVDLHVEGLAPGVPPPGDHVAGGQLLADDPPGEIAVKRLVRPSWSVVATGRRMASYVVVTSPPSASTRAAGLPRSS